MIKVFLTNLGKYNEGYLIGEWLELPATQEEIDACMERIGINEEYEEWFITDYETDIKGIEIGEYSNLDELNDIAEELEALNEDVDIIEAIFDYCQNMQDTINKIQNRDYIIYYDCDDMIDVAIEIVKECGYLNGVSETVARYFDYEAFGEDLDNDGYFVSLNGNRYIQIF